MKQDTLPTGSNEVVVGEWQVVRGVCGAGWRGTAAAGDDEDDDGCSIISGRKWCVAEQLTSAPSRVRGRYDHTNFVRHAEEAGYPAVVADLVLWRTRRHRPSCCACLFHDARGVH